MTIDRPERKNALTPNMYFGVRRAVDLVNASPSLHALVLTGVGDVFAPGGELGGQYEEEGENMGALLGSGTVPFEAIRESRKPVISSVNGLCMGGGLLIAMLSDLAIASDRAVFAAPELLRGVADTYHAAILPEQIGIARARDLLFTGRKVRAEEALQMGMVARVVPHDELAAATERALGEILQSAPVARMHLKRIINARYGHVDKLTFDESISSAEVVEGFGSFVEKRSPGWIPDEFRQKGRLDS